MLPDLVRWEAVLLAELGYGLDLAACAVTGATDGPRLCLAAHRPRGRARRRPGNGATRLLPLPGFLVGGNTADRRGLARRAAPDRPFPGARRLRPPAPPAAPGARGAVSTASPADEFAFCSESGCTGRKPARTRHA